MARLPNFGASLWYDELWATKIKVGEVHLVLKSLYYDAHPPLHLGLMYAWVNVFGDNEPSIRSVSLILGIASVIVLRSLSTRFVDGRSSILAPLLLAIAPAHVWCSQAARSYALVVFLALAVALTLERLAERSNSKLRLAAYSISILLLALSHFYGTALAACAVPISAFRVGRGRRLWAIVAGIVPLILVGVFYLFWFSVSGLPSGKAYAGSFGLSEAWNLFSDWLITANAINSHMAVRIAILLSLAIGLYRYVKEGRKALLIIVLALGVPALLFVLTAIGRKNTYLPRSAALALPFYMMLISAGLLALRPRALRIGAAGATIALELIALIVFYGRQPANETGLPHPDWRHIARVLETQMGGREGHQILLSTVAAPLSYYSSEFCEEADTVVDESVMSALNARVANSRIWSVIAKPAIMFAEKQFALTKQWKERNAGRAKLIVRYVRLSSMAESAIAIVRSRGVVYIAVPDEAVSGTSDDLNSKGILVERLATDRVIGLIRAVAKR